MHSLSSSMTPNLLLISTLNWSSHDCEETSQQYQTSMESIALQIGFLDLKRNSNTRYNVFVCLHFSRTANLHFSISFRTTVKKYMCHILNGHQKQVFIHSLSSCMTPYLVLISTFYWFSNNFETISQTILEQVCINSYPNQSPTA